MRYTKSWLVVLAIALGAGVAEAGTPNQAAALVDSWYRQYLKRCADPSGLDSWTYHLSAGMSPVCVQGAILGSDEYYAIHGACPAGFVSGLYEDVLGRPAASEEINTWAAQLGHCGSRGKLAESFLLAAQSELAAASCQPPVAAPAPYALAPVIAAPVRVIPAPVVIARPPVFAAPAVRPVVTVSSPRFTRVVARHPGEFRSVPHHRHSHRHFDR